MYKFYPLYAYLISLIVAQLLKPFIVFIKTKEFDWYYIISSGGYPSSHSSSVVSLCLACGLKEGFDSTYFALSFALMAIVMYDAFNVRWYAGQNIKVTKQIISDLKDVLNSDNPIYSQKLKDVLGHTKLETISGIILGIIVSLVLYFIWS